MHESHWQRIGRRTGSALVWLAMLALLAVATAAAADWVLQLAVGGG
jgi:hypothetical protein